MILIVESGSTTSHWRIISSSTAKPVDFKSQGINPYYQSIEEIEESQLPTLEQLQPFPIDDIYYYGTGITDEKEVNVIKQVLSKIVSTTDQIHVHNDLESAAISTIGDEEGIACILGTGSNSGYFQNGKLVEQIPPLGFWLGDEGSGGHLGKCLILAYLHKELPDDLRELFCKRFGELQRIDILQKAYKEEYPNRWFATFSKFLFDHRKHPFIYHLIQDSFEQFCKKYLLKYSQIADSKVHFTGSVAFYFSDILRRTLGSHGITVGVISENPMAGLTFHHKKSLKGN